MDLIQIAQETFQTEAEALLTMTERLDQNFLDAIETIFSTKGKLIVTGVGKSGLVGAKMAATFASTGTSSFFLHPTEALHGDLGMIGKDDTLLAISSSGESEELTKILPHIKRFEIQLIGLTGNADSTLARYADVWIDISVEKEACPLNVAPTTSTTLTMALGDALAVALMHKRGFRKEDFASFHPGGSLGKRLFVKIKDLMRTENLPVIKENTPLKEAVVAMSEGKLGTVLVVDENDAFTALLSDGDLRRALMREDFSMEQPAIDYATQHPKSYSNTELLASEALEIIENERIQLLPITDEAGKIIGVLHIHDLVNAGIKSR
ncbi:KpsF/GutQ family sugar-phosphate isomerase [Sulfurovum sp. NBC37-1]|uniref:KpsF/GutQ family sugar-phosphate isomerase n=1 Tax=Sulfurovum sp. (strain NBC37-1) TaxID=387093 RepID=UPI0001587A26|nr:KpsF/GutQ family sugar-phosphate isomerase [Sulfurovum sp. NBC37-1]BAF73300.1 arabinose-5-phosphate isomerase [Sulfurovum sp. NBC37-1]